MCTEIGKNRPWQPSNRRFLRQPHVVVMESTRWHGHFPLRLIVATDGTNQFGDDTGPLLSTVAYPNPGAVHKDGQFSRSQTVTIATFLSSDNFYRPFLIMWSSQGRRNGYVFQCARTLVEIGPDSPLIAAFYVSRTQT